MLLQKKINSHLHCVYSLGYMACTIHIKFYIFNIEACDTIQNVAGGTVSLSTDGVMTLASFTCETGYTMSGDSSISCRSDGTWNVSQPLCSKLFSSRR